MRWIIAALAAAVLALAVAPLLRSQPESPSIARRPADPATEPVAPAATPTPARPVSDRGDAIADTITTIIIDIARGRTEEGDRKEMRGRLISTLASEGLGDQAGRKAAAEVAVSSIFKRTEEARAAGRPVGDMKLRAVKALSREFARELRSRLPAGKSAKHSGALSALAPEPKVPAGFQKVSWKTLSGWDYQEGQKLPPAVTALSGSRVGISGYMIVLSEKDGGVSEFLLVQSLWDCCFGMPPDLHQGIVVRYQKTGLQFSSRAIQVLGSLEVGEDLDESGTVLSVYRLTSTSAKTIN